MLSGSITFMSDGNADTRPSTLSPELQLINQDKYNKLGKIAMDFVRYQTPFNYHELETVQTFLRRTLAERGSNSLEALYRKSCKWTRWTLHGVWVLICSDVGAETGFGEDHFVFGEAELVGRQGVDGRVQRSFPSRETWEIYLEPDDAQFHHLMIRPLAIASYAYVVGWSCQK